MSCYDGLKGETWTSTTHLAVTVGPSSLKGCSVRGSLWRVRTFVLPSDNDATHPTPVFVEATSEPELAALPVSRRTSFLSSWFLLPEHCQKVQHVHQRAGIHMTCCQVALNQQWCTYDSSIRWRGTVTHVSLVAQASMNIFNKSQLLTR